jgi:hypothetical protein
MGFKRFEERTAIRALRKTGMQGTRVNTFVSVGSKA